MTTRYDLIVGRDVTRNGQTKTYWTRVGSMFNSKSGEGFTIKLDSYPLPNAQGEVWVKAVVPKEQNGGEHVMKNGPRQSLSQELNDDIPF